MCAAVCAECCGGQRRRRELESKLIRKTRKRAAGEAVVMGKRSKVWGRIARGLGLLRGLFCTCLPASRAIPSLPRTPHSHRLTDAVHYFCFSGATSSCQISPRQIYAYQFLFLGLCMHHNRAAQTEVVGGGSDNSSGEQSALQQYLYTQAAHANIRINTARGVCGISLNPRSPPHL